MESVRESVRESACARVCARVCACALSLYVCYAGHGYLVLWRGLPLAKKPFDLVDGTRGKHRLPQMKLGERICGNARVLAQDEARHVLLVSFALFT